MPRLHLIDDDPERSIELLRRCPESSPLAAREGAFAVIQVARSFAQHGADRRVASRFQILALVSAIAQPVLVRTEYVLARQPLADVEIEQPACCLFVPTAGF